MPTRSSNHGLNVATITLACAALTSSCMSEAPTDPVGSGGMTSGAGGSLSAGTGGAAASGGAGGTPMNVGGGAGVVTAGTTSTGGASATGGSSPAGGSAGTITAGAAGQASGGTSGGSGTNGTGGAGAAGASGAGGSAGSSGAAGSGTNGGTGGAATSSGCGATTAPESDTYTIESGGMTREYILAVPDDYDPTRPYRLIFGWHWRGGSAENVAGGQLGGGAYYGLESRAEGSAIFVAPEGLDAGWANTGGRDIEFLRAMLDRLNAELCIDQDRIFSTGFSYGGMMSLAVGCAMGDVFRAIVPISGAIYSGCEDGTSPVAFMGIHGDNDDVVPLANGEAGRDEFLARNGCDAASAPVDPSPCVTYEGCETGYPVTWCEFAGGHSPPSFSGEATWDFFSQF